MYFSLDQGFSSYNNIEEIVDKYTESRDLDDNRSTFRCELSKLRLFSTGHMRSYKIVWWWPFQFLRFEFSQRLHCYGNHFLSYLFLSFIRIMVFYRKHIFSIVKIRKNYVANVPNVRTRPKKKIPASFLLLLVSFCGYCVDRR